MLLNGQRKHSVFIILLTPIFTQKSWTFVFFAFFFVFSQVNFISYYFCYKNLKKQTLFILFKKTYIYVLKNGVIPFISSLFCFDPPFSLIIFISLFLDTILFFFRKLNFISQCLSFKFFFLLFLNLFNVFLS